MLSPYEVLGVPETASLEEIKDAYRDLVLQHHPDKSSGGDAAKFIQVQQAYEQLKVQAPSSLETGKLLQALLECVSEFVSSLVDKAQRDITVDVPVTLDDIYHKKVKMVTIRVKRRGCAQLVPEEFLVPLMNYQPEYVFAGKGDQCIIPKFADGDVRVRLSIQQEEDLYVHDLFSRFDLCRVVHLSLWDHYFSPCARIRHFDQDIDVPYQRNGRETTSIVTLPGLGLPLHHGRGDLHVRFVVDLPEDVCSFAQAVVQQAAK